MRQGTTKKDNGCPAKWRGIFAGGMLYEQKEGNYRTFNCGGCTVPDNEELG